MYLVNLINRMMMKVPVHELIPISEQQVRVRLPDGLRAKKVHLLAANKTPRMQHNGDELTIIFPSILDHEIVAIDV